jgi:hypothetical protein
MRPLYLLNRKGGMVQRATRLVSRYKTTRISLDAKQVRQLPKHLLKYAIKFASIILEPAVDRCGEVVTT